MSDQSEHLSAEDLPAFGLGLLDSDQTDAMASHVAACPACCEALLSVPDDALVSRLREALTTSGEVLAAHETPATTFQGPEVDPTDRPAPLPFELTSHPRYRVEKLLGAGGMGAVYRAYHRVLERPVALKVIKPGLMTKPGIVERFSREVKAAARLSHPNIVTAYDADQAGGTHLLVMEYVDGIDLGRLVQDGGSLPVERACAYVRQAALGLQHAFEQGLVHRDLKPHNLMLTPDGRVKILDFGLAVFTSEAASAGLTSTGIVLGTADYMAPEQADNAHQADIRSDIYSLGCTLYHLLAGQPPFPTGTSLQKVMAHVEKTPQPLSELRPDLPEELMPVLEHMMAKNPKHRFQTPVEVAFALEPFIRPTTVPRAPMPRPRTRQADPDCTIVLEKTPVRDRRRPQFMIATAILAFLIAGLLGTGVYRIATDNGELVIQTNNDDVEVVVSQSGRVVKIIDTKSGKQVTLNSGDYELALKDGPQGLKISPEKITLKRGKTELATITRRGNAGDGLPEPPPAGRPPEGVVAWWRADGNAKDSVGANHGTLKGGVTFAPGIAGRAFRLDGATRYVEVPRSDRWGFGSRDFSIELWSLFRAVTPSHDIGQPSAVFIGCDEGNGPGGGHKWFFAYGGGFLNFHITNANGKGGFYAKADFSPDLDKWDHLAVTRSRGMFTIYVNGVPVSSEKVDTIIPYPDAPLTIGQAEGGYFFSGLIDEVAIYDRALSPAEVKSRWSALAPATIPLAEKVGEVRQFNGHSGMVTAVAFFKDGRRFASCSRDGTIRIWEVATGNELAPPLKGHNHSDIDGIALSPDQRYLLSGGFDRTLRLWDIEAGKQLHTFAHFNRVPGMAFAPDSRWALSGSHDRRVRLWDLKDLKDVHCFTSHTGCVETVAVSSDGHRAASASFDGTVRLWDLDKRREIACLRAHTSGVHGVAFSPDGKRVLSASADKTLRLWDAVEGRPLQVYEGHTEGVRHVAFSPDGRRALSAGFDGTIRLWDVNASKELHCFAKHQGAALDVAFSPDGRSALSCGADHTIRLWRLPDPPPDNKNH
jgi:WD40 repeat protein/serine/threonine protein kinase